ncbi:MAG: helix-turn-helix domain-containing protein [Limisphaerales bacterium]
MDLRQSKCQTNMVGPQIRRLRTARGWSQSKLAMRLQLGGLDISRAVLGQMESQLHCIKDKDIPHFARALGADLADIFIGFGR